MLGLSLTTPTPDVSVLCEDLANVGLLSSDADFEARYELLGELGRGGYAVVFSARPRKPLASDERAVKVLDKVLLASQGGDSARVVRRLRDELRVCLELTHPRLVKLYEIVETPHSLYIVMQKAGGGALLERIIERGAFSEEGARHVMRQVLDALSFMHKHGVIHRDIKPENILLEGADGWDVVITDFGLVKIFSDQDSLATSMTRIANLGLEGSFSRHTAGGVTANAGREIDRCDSCVGTRFYRAPEQIFCDAPYPTTYGAGVDVWASGVVLYILLSGTYPFAPQHIPPPPVAAPASDSSPAASPVFDAPLQRFLRFPREQFANVSVAARAAITAMLTVDPKARPTADEMRRHPWLCEPAPERPQTPQKMNLSASYMDTLHETVRAAKRAREDAWRSRGSLCDSRGSSGVFGSGVFGSGVFARSVTGDDGGAHPPKSVRLHGAEGGGEGGEGGGTPAGTGTGGEGGCFPPEAAPAPQAPATPRAAGRAERLVTILQCFRRRHERLPTASELVDAFKPHGSLDEKTAARLLELELSCEGVFSE